jgi:hypothetical protein
MDGRLKEMALNDGKIVFTVLGFFSLGKVEKSSNHGIIAITPP